MRHNDKKKIDRKSTMYYELQQYLGASHTIQVLSLCNANVANKQRRIKQLMLQHSKEGPTYVNLHLTGAEKKR